jgi:hypothetical protein
MTSFRGSRNPSEPSVLIATRFVEAKGRAAVGEVTLMGNEHRTSQRFVEDYWLYMVFNRGSQLNLYTIQDPAHSERVPAVQVEHDHITSMTTCRGRHV